MKKIVKLFLVAIVLICFSGIASAEEWKRVEVKKDGIVISFEVPASVEFVKETVLQDGNIYYEFKNPVGTRGAMVLLSKIPKANWHSSPFHFDVMDDQELGAFLKLLNEKLDPNYQTEYRLYKMRNGHLGALHRVRDETIIGGEMIIVAYPYTIGIMTGGTEEFDNLANFRRPWDTLEIRVEN